MKIGYYAADTWLTVGLERSKKGAVCSGLREGPVIGVQSRLECVQVQIGVHAQCGLEEGA